MINQQKKKLRYILAALGVLIFHLCGGFHHLFAKEFNEEFDYPYNGNVKFLVDQMMTGAEFTPSNIYYFKYKTNPKHQCNSSIDVLFIVKSAPENYLRRDIIRRTWGSKKQTVRKIRTIFLIGERESETEALTNEYKTYKDLVQGNFTDAYFNNTIKTMMGFKWAYEFCSKKSDYFMFVDDDYYVSPKNLFKFLKKPFTYPGRDVTLNKYSFTEVDPDKFELYAGYVFDSSPLRFYFSKWYVPLSEYQYNKWPRYVTAGAYVLTKLSLIRMYYASLFTDHFRFDDIYLGIIAYKLKIDPIHNDNFNFNNNIDDLNYEQIIASHGFDDPEKLWLAWNKKNVNTN